MVWPIVAAIVTSTAVQATGQIKAGRAQEREYKRQAQQEKMAAESRELERQQKLNAALAANIAGMGAAGIKFEGTPASIALESAKQASLSEGVLKLSDRLQQAQLRRQGAAARSASQYAAASTLLDGAVSAYQAMPEPGQKDT